MTPQRFGQREPHPGEALRQAVAGVGQVTADVNAGGEEVGQQHHAPDPGGDTLSSRSVDIRLCQLQERRLDRLICSPAARRRLRSVSVTRATVALNPTALNICCAASAKAPSSGYDTLYSSLICVPFPAG